LGQGVAAFGIGAAGGAAAALTGGAATSALGLGTTGALSGLVGGSLGETIGGPITGIGNGIVFGDSYGMGDFVSGVLWGGVFGAGLGAWDAARKGLNPILGDIKPRNSTQDLIKVTLGGKQIEVPGLEVSATQPTDGFNIVAANQTGLYSGNGTNYASTSGWVKKKIFQSLDSKIQEKIVTAIAKGVTTRGSGIRPLAPKEIAKYGKGYTHKVWISGKGTSHYRILGKQLENGHWYFSELINNK